MGTTTALTWEEFLAAGNPDQRWEYVDGEIQFMSPVGLEHSYITNEISRLLKNWEDHHPDWKTFGTDSAFTMSSGEWLCPDAAAVKSERFPGGVIPKGPAPFPPDVAFEVISPNDKQKEILRKKLSYLTDGVAQVWVHPDKRMVEVMIQDRVRYCFEGEVVTLDELPGFEMNLFKKR